MDIFEFLPLSVLLTKKKLKGTAVPFITNFLLCLQIVKSVLCFVEGEIPGWDRLELNGNSVSVLST